MRVLVIEDEKSLAGLLEQSLMRQGFGVTLCHSLAEARARLTQPFDIIICDRRLPDGDGLELVGERRAAGDDTPVLMLTAMGLPKERVDGLNAGADDYLPKPFSLYELEARLRALLRRSRSAQGMQLSFGNVVLDTLHQSVSVGGTPLPLSLRELHLLTALLRQAGQVVGKAALTESLYGDNDRLKSGPNALEVALHRLRKLLAGRGANVSIETVRGVGYWLKEPAR